MSKAILSLFSLCLLAACMSPQERVEQEKLQIGQDVETCKSYGLKEGSEAFGNCRLQLDLARENRSIYRNYSIYGGFGRRGGGIGTGVHF